MIKLGNKLLAIEVKSTRMLMDSLIGEDNTYIIKDMDRLIIVPLKQLHDSLEALFNEEHVSVSGVDELYLMTVTLGDFPKLPPIDDWVSKRISNNFKLNIRAYFHINV